MPLTRLADIEHGAGSALAFAADGAGWAATTTGVTHLGRGSELLASVAVPGVDRATPRWWDDELRVAGWSISADGRPTQLWAAAPDPRPAGGSGDYTIVDAAWSDRRAIVATHFVLPRGIGAGSDRGGPAGQVLLLDGDGGVYRELVPDSGEGRGQRLVAASGSAVAAAGAFGLGVWSDGGDELWRPDVGRRWEALAMTGARVIAVGADHVALLANLEGGERREWRLGESTVSAVALDSTGSLAATGGDDRTVSLWDITGSAPTLMGTLSLGQPVTGLAFTPDGGRLLAGLRLPNSLALLDLS